MTQADPPSPSTMQRAAAIKAAMNGLAKIKAARMITGALRQCNGPRVSQLHDAAVGSKVLVWCIVWLWIVEECWNGIGR